MSHRTRTMTQQLPPVSRRTEGVSERNKPLFEDQIREYRRNQRRRFVADQAIRRTTERIRGRRYNQTLEQTLNPDEELKQSMQQRANIVPAEVLYRSRRDTVNHQVYTHRSEEAMLCVGQQEDRAFIQTPRKNQLEYRWSIILKIL